MSRSFLDPGQIIQHAYDDATQRIRVDAEVTANISGSQEVIISEADDSILVYGNDGSTNKKLKTDSSGELQIDVLSSALPTGAATSTLQSAGNLSLSNIDSDIDVALSTRASQVTVASIDSKLNTLGQKVSASSAPVVLSSDQSAIPVTDNGGSLTIDAVSLPLPTGAATAALQTQPGIDIGDVTINNAVGASAVNIQDGGNSITIDAVSLPLPTGASTSALQTTGNTSLSSIDSKIPSGLTVTSTRLLIDGSGVTQPISVASLPLPSGAATAALQTQPGVDIGDVTINNAAGAASVNIQDGGNSITVDGPLTDAQLRATAVPVSGSLSITSAKVATYSASVVGLTVAGSATDVFTITGSGTKTVTINRILISGVKTTSTNIDVLLIKRSTANTGGTSAAATATPNDSANAAATATVLSYTANPTLGTSVGTVRASKVFINSAGGGQSDGIDHRFDSEKFQGIILRGVAQVLAVNLNGVSLAGSSLNMCVEWSEE